MNKIKFLIITAISSLALILSIVNFSGQKKIGFFDYNEVYNNCSLKVKLEKDLEQIASGRKSELDSLQMELSFLSEKIKAGSASSDELTGFEDLKNRYLTFQQQYEEENVRLKETYFTQIRQEILAKSKLFSEKNGFDYLFTLVNDGSLLYGADGEDVTKDFQEFVDNQ